MHGRSGYGMTLKAGQLGLTFGQCFLSSCHDLLALLELTLRPRMGALRLSQCVP
jgi:hypothetical protein